MADIETFKHLCECFFSVQNASFKTASFLFDHFCEQHFELKKNYHENKAGKKIDGKNMQFSFDSNEPTFQKVSFLALDFPFISALIETRHTVCR